MIPFKPFCKYFFTTPIFIVAPANKWKRVDFSWEIKFLLKLNLFIKNKESSLHDFGRLWVMFFYADTSAVWCVVWIGSPWRLLKSDSSIFNQKTYKLNALFTVWLRLPFITIDHRPTHLGRSICPPKWMPLSVFLFTTICCFHGFYKNLITV